MLLGKIITTDRSIHSIFKSFCPEAGFTASGFAKMFGCLGAALAFYSTAKPEKRKIVGGLLFSAALTSFLTGITEPIEFTFLFIAPGLFILHCGLQVCHLH